MIIKELIRRAGLSVAWHPTRGLSLYEGFSEKSLEERRFYNIGAAGFSLPHWTNIDLDSDYYSGVQKPGFINHDLMSLQPLPVEDDVAEVVYSSHAIEHISNDAAMNMLKESRRILKPGGYFRLTAPDALLAFAAYRKKDATFWHSCTCVGSWRRTYKMPPSRASIQQLFLHHFASQLCEIDIDENPGKKYTDKEIEQAFAELSVEDALDYFTRQCSFSPDYPRNHINWWTHEKTLSCLREAGFSESYRSGYGQSLCPPMRDISFFDNTHPEMSLYLEAVK